MQITDGYRKQIKVCLGVVVEGKGEGEMTDVH